VNCPGGPGSEAGCRCRGRAVDLVHHREDLIGIALVIVLLPEVKIVERFAIEKPDGCGWLNGGLLALRD